MELFLLGMRNIARNKRRTALNVVALTVGISLIALFLGWMRGYFDGLYRSAIDSDTGHLQVLHADYLAEERKLPLDKLVSGYAALRAELSADPRVEAVTGRINFAVTLSKAGATVRLAGIAIDPEAERDVTKIADQVVAGDYLAAQDGILMGKPVAEKLGVTPGDSVYLSGLDQYGAVNRIDVVVVGIFNYGFPAMDRGLLYADLDTAARLLGTSDEVTRVVVRLQPGIDYDALVADLGARYADRNLSAYPWQRFAQVVISAANQDLVTFGTLLVFLFAFIAVGVYNSMSMSIMERTRELSTLRAVGIKRSRLVGLLLSESLGISLIAFVASLVIGGALALFLQFRGIDMSALLDGSMPLPFARMMTAQFTWYDFPLAGLLGSLVALLGTFFPAAITARRRIAESMGSSQLV